jgi:hypothetical protein
MKIESDYRQDGYQKGLVEGKKTDIYAKLKTLFTRIQTGDYPQKKENTFIYEKRAPVIEGESDLRIFCPKCDSKYTQFIGLCPKCGSGYTQVI